MVPPPPLLPPPHYETVQARSILRRTGWVLLILGILNLSYFITSAIIDLSTVDPLDLTSFIGAFFLLRGNLRVARIIAFSAAFLIGAAISLMICLLFTVPLDLLTLYVKLHRDEVAAPDLLILVVLLALLIWLYRELTSSVVETAMVQAGIEVGSFWRKPRNGLGIGAAIPALIFVILSSMMTGETVTEAKRRAAEQIGPGFKFHISSLSIAWNSSGRRTRILVTAYNDEKIEEIVVEYLER